MFFSLKIMTELSAHKIISKLQELRKSLIYSKNKNGHKTLPCGTPISVGKRFKKNQFIINHTKLKLINQT